MPRSDFLHVAVTLTSLYAHHFNKMTIFSLTRYEKALMNKTWVNFVGKVNTHIHICTYICMCKYGYVCVCVRVSSLIEC